MDTRSVTRSRRQSARLHQQPRDDKKTAKQIVPNRRVSDTDLSRARTKSANLKLVIPKAPTIKRSHSATDLATDTQPEGASGPPVTAKGWTKHEERGADSPMFPNLQSAKDSRVDFENAALYSDKALSTTSSVEANVEVGTNSRGHRVGARWVKTTQGAMRLVDDTIDNTSADPSPRSEETPVVDASLLPDYRRRSARLAGSTPGVEEMKTPFTIVDTNPKQPTTPEKKSAAPTMSLKRGSEAESQCALYTPSSASSIGSSLTDIDDLPPYNNVSFAGGPEEDVDFAEKTSPIPDLVADIARIIETSSPIAARASQANAFNIETPTKPSAMETTATTALAPESVRIPESPTGAIHQVDDTSQAQLTTAGPLPHDSTSGEGFSGMEGLQDLGADELPAHAATANIVVASQYQSGNPHGVKRPAEEMSHDVQTPVRNGPVGASNRPNSLVTPTKSANLIESASSRDCYDVEDDELGSPGAGLWLDGEAYDAQSLHHRDLPRAVEQITAQGYEHNPTASQHAASLPPQLHDITKCGDCGKTPRKFIVCARCMETRYCGKYCQIWNWPIHRQSCHVLREVNPDQVKRQEEYLQGMWDGALGVLKDNAVDLNAETGGNVRGQTSVQAMVDSRFMGHAAGQNIVEQGVALLGGGGGAVTGEDGAGQEDIGMSSDVVMGGTGMTGQHVGDDVQDEEDAFFKMPPPTPDLMFRSRAMALHLAQAAYASAE